jgi:hypothetical protein
VSDESWDSFEAFVEALKPGRAVRLGGLLRYRQGGDPRDWSQPGAIKYVPVDYQVLVGSIQWSGTASASGALEVIFPAPFSQDPIVLCTPVNTTPLFQDVRAQMPIASPLTAEIHWFAAADLTALVFHWLAIGPVGSG